MKYGIQKKLFLEMEFQLAYRIKYFYLRLQFAHLYFANEFLLVQVQVCFLF